MEIAADIGQLDYALDSPQRCLHPTPSLSQSRGDPLHTETFINLLLTYLLLTLSDFIRIRSPQQTHENLDYFFRLRGHHSPILY